jgi:tRNA(Ile)-lysidine synthase
MPSQKVPGVEQKVADFFRGQGPISLDKPLVVAVSGGPDSICLLHVLFSLRKELGLRLHVAHLDHGLRGEESVGDAQYVLDLCHKLGVPVTIEQRDVRAYQEQHRLTLEEAAREVRYGFFADAADSIGAGCVAVGHTRDDHVETVLLHIIRGTGTRGLRGLQPVSRLHLAGINLTVIRPLLIVSREETAAYCRRHRLHPRLDTSNLSPEFLRNRMRLELLPLLESYNPRIVEALARTARITADDIDVLDKVAQRHWRRTVQKEGNAIVFNRERFRKTAPGLQRVLLRMALEGLLGTLKDIEARHIEGMLSVISKPAGKKVSLPFGLTFVVEYDRFRLERGHDDTAPFPLLDREYPLAVPGVTAIPGWRIQAEVLSGVQKADADNLTALFDFRCVAGGIAVRPRRPGDRFQPLGMNEEKKVGRFMMDAHIPQAWRSRIPIVCDAEKVLWVVGYRIDGRAKVTDGTKRVLRLRFERV